MYRVLAAWRFLFEEFGFSKTLRGPSKRPTRHHALALATGGHDGVVGGLEQRIHIVGLADYLQRARDPRAKAGISLTTLPKSQ